MESLAFLTTFHLPTLFLPCRAARLCTPMSMVMASIVLVFMGVSWHRHTAKSGALDHYFWMLIALLGLLSPLECAHWHRTHHMSMILVLALTAWLAYKLNDALLVVASVWLVYEVWCMLS